MSRRKPSGSWKLKDEHARQVQGLVVSGFDHLPYTQIMLVRFDWAGERRGGSWLRALKHVAPVTPADGKREGISVALGITAAGLAAMGVEQETLDGFSEPFRQGMFEIERMRRLNDRIGDEWTGCVLPGGPLWSANTPPAPVPPDCDPPPSVATPLTVHAVVLLFAATEDALTQAAPGVKAALQAEDVLVSREKTITLIHEPDDGMIREHFGFVDGLSQPLPWDRDALVDPGNAPDPWNGVALGDILLGHVDSHHETSVGPMVSPPDHAARAELGAYDPDNPHNLDLGLNGTYLVVRELQQDVAGFWQGLARAAAALGHDPQDGAVWLGERVIGRSMDGDVLRPDGPLPRRNPGFPDNDFGFYDDDRYGLGCPLGAHMRRGNPRDGLARKPGHKHSLLASANSHRILRRGRKYGERIADPMVDDGQERGLMFLAINADIQRQFEAVQQTWMMNPAFAALFDETDPLAGPTSTFTIPADPVRHRTKLDNYVKLAGGEYFFMPSLPALRWLEDLP